MNWIFLCLLSTCWACASRATPNPGQARGHFASTPGKPDRPVQYLHHDSKETMELPFSCRAVYGAAEPQPVVQVRLTPDMTPAAVGPVTDLAQVRIGTIMVMQLK